MFEGVVIEDAADHVRLRAATGETFYIHHGMSCQLDQTMWVAVRPEKIFVGKGCDECFNSGFAGRTALYEVMPIDTVIQEQIINKATASQIKRGALERGLRTLRMDGVNKLLAGHTTPEEVLRVTQLDVS